MEREYHGTTPAPVLVDFGISYVATHAFVVALQGVVVSGVGKYLLSPSPATPAGRVADLLMMNLRFTYGVAGDGDLEPIWEEVVSFKERKEGLANLNQALLRRLP